MTGFIEFVHTEDRLFSPFNMSVPLFQSTKLASIYARPPVVCHYAAARQRVSAIRTGSIAPSRRGFVQTNSQHQQERHSRVQCPYFLSHKGPRSYSMEPDQVWIVQRRGYKTVEEMRSRYKFGVCCPRRPFRPFVYLLSGFSRWVYTQMSSTAFPIMRLFEVVLCAL